MTYSPLKSDLDKRSALNKRFSLPEPDRANITVLTNILPNNPVLPWNRYDSPWLPEDAEREPSLNSPHLGSAHHDPRVVNEAMVSQLEAAPVSDCEPVSRRQC